MTIEGGLEDLEEEIRLLSSREEIKELKSKFCRDVDEQNYENLQTLFSEDALIIYSHLNHADYGEYQGPEGIRDFVESMVDEIVGFRVHMIHNPILSVNGDQAEGRWYFEVPVVFKDTNTPGWVQGTYHDEFRRNEEGWRISRLEGRFNYIAQYKDGWDANNIPE